MWFHFYFRVRREVMSHLKMDKGQRFSEYISHISLKRASLTGNIPIYPIIRLLANYTNKCTLILTTKQNGNSIIKIF